jgi:hypothetical protein
VKKQIKSKGEKFIVLVKNMDHHHLGATGYTAKKKIYMAGGRKGDS